MKILYLPAHSILEYDEVKLLTELGHEVFSPGSYICPENPGDPTMRPSISGLQVNPEWNEKWHQMAGRMPGVDPKYNLEADFVKMFDCCVVMHIPEWIENNWEAFVGKRVIWRTIGQSIQPIEDRLKPYREKGLQIVRYSPKELNIPGFIGQDALIRFYKDPEEYGDWTGEDARVITFAQAMKRRDTACNFTFFEEATQPFPRALYGPGNEGSGDFALGAVPHNKQKEILRKSRCFFNTGTHPASYTLSFIESWMTGIPIIALGHKLGNAEYFIGHDLYEVHELIDHGRTGFIVDDIPSARYYINQMLKYPQHAKEISDNERKEAIRHFGKQMILESWRAFLG